MSKNVKIGKLYELPTAKAGWRVVKVTGRDHAVVVYQSLNSGRVDRVKRRYFEGAYRPRNRLALACGVFWKILGA